MSPSNSKREIDASPTKSFFIATLVKDIQLIDSILDLIDNSIDSYIENNLEGRRKISINFSENKFEIEDNCGGIKKEDIYDKVFRFGLPKGSKEKTIGVFGIGMKRAIFKIGENILIESDDGKEYYSINIGKTWLTEEKNWKLVFKSEEKTKGKPMTKITITELFENISQELKNPKFENNLRERIKDSYSIFIDGRVDIETNNSPVDSYDFNFLYDEKNKFVPFHKNYKFGEVDVEIYAGYTPSVELNADKIYGWWIFCNDRLVIKNDTTEKTGWGITADDEIKYHYPEDNRFLGLVFFRSDNAISLPWHTTKEDIQEDSRVYRQAQIEMKTVTKRFVDVIRIAGRTKDPDSGETIGKALFEDIASKPRKEIKKDLTEVLPILKGIQVYKKYTYVTYVVPKELVKKVKKKLGNAFMSNKEAGEKTFDYYVKMEDVENE